MERLSFDLDCSKPGLHRLACHVGFPHRAVVAEGLQQEEFVGGGTSYSMLKTLDETYKIQQLLGERLNPFESFYHMTLGNAEAVSLEGRIGTLEAGTDADLVVLDASATPAMALRMEVVRSLADELFLLQTLGDDRAVRETYVAGKAMKDGL